MYTFLMSQQVGERNVGEGMAKEAKARIKINKLLEEAGWRFLDDKQGKANILLENHIKIQTHELDAFGDDFEKTKNGYIDFLLLNKDGYPFIVLEAKSEDKNPLVGKEQARTYAHSQNCRFVILSNGSTHYFWDIKIGNPKLISKFPRPNEVESFEKFVPNQIALVNEAVGHDYIARSQKPNYVTDPDFLDNNLRSQYLLVNKLRFLRPYQLQAIEALQKAVKIGNDRFLFEMATGTGKTLVAAAIIKLFLRTGNARRVLFLVDRLELEDQAEKAFINYLKNDYRTVIYKDNRDSWRKAEIVISTVQTFLSNNRYKRVFAPNDFDLVISDEAHRSIGGNARAVFEYFMGYKLGLTATPKDYLKNLDADAVNQNSIKDMERRMLLDTYRTFGCENQIPTFRYSLVDGVKDGFLVNPVVVDARTEITTQLLSDKGYEVVTEDEEGDEISETFIQRDFERKFFSDKTNIVFCKTFLENALLDPISREIGKTIVFCVSQNHAAKIAQILNEMADQLFPGKYQSDFALQVTSVIHDAQQFTINFVNNRLSGTSNFNEAYRTSKTRVAVTVGMMTTGYDCPDILNLCLMRPIFSPTDFIQIKGRGTRKHNFTDQIIDQRMKDKFGEMQKDKFKILDFFANCEYFEEKYNYDEVLKLPQLTSSRGVGEGGGETFEFESGYLDRIAKLSESTIGADGMKIDRMYFQKFGDQVKNDPFVIEKVLAGELESAAEYIEKNIFDKPKEFYTLDKLRKSVQSDRRVPLKELLAYLFGLLPYIKSKNELLDDEFDKFDSRFLPDEKTWLNVKHFFKAYILDADFRQIIESGNFTQLNVNPNGDTFQKITPQLRKLIPEYIKDYIPLNQFL